MSETSDVPCRFCGAPAVGIYYFDKGCVCYPDDRMQSLCEQHIVKATPIGNMRLIGRPPGVRRIWRRENAEFPRVPLGALPW
jgi:hypothetical protein